MTTTATAGNRQLELEIQDDSVDVILRLQPGNIHGASTTINYLLAPGIPDLTAFRDTSYLMTPIPPTLILPAGYVVRIYDNNVVDAAADDMVVQIMVGEKDV